MTIFTIDAENNIRAFPSAESTLVAGPEAQSFTSHKEFAKLGSDWPLTRLVETWNRFAGVVPWDDLKPVKKFTSRDTAVRRIWQAVQKIAPQAEPAMIAAPAAEEMPRSAAAADSGVPPKPPKPRRVSKKSIGKRARAKQRSGPSREGTKKAAVLALIERSKGATLAEIQKATGWQAHTVRGFISATLGKKMGLAVESSRRQDGQRVYALPGRKA